MKKKYFLLFAVLIGSLNIQAQNMKWCNYHECPSGNRKEGRIDFNDFHEGLALIYSNDNYRYGYVDSILCLVIPAIYNYTGPFSEGHALVLLNDKYNYIDKAGKVSALKYDKGLYPNENRAAVKLKEKWGFINTLGEEIVAPNYDSVGDYFHGFAAVWKNNKCGFINLAGKEVVPLKYDKVEYKRTEWYINPSHESPRNYTKKFTPFSDGFAVVQLNGKWGCIDSTGKEIGALKYDWLSLFNNGRAMVKLNNKYGYIDKTGREITPLKYGYVHPFYKGFAMVRSNALYGYIDTTGKEVILPKYSRNDYDDYGIYPSDQSDYDSTDNVSVSLKYDWAEPLSDDLVKVKINRKEGDEIDNLDGFPQTRDKWGIVDKTGKEILPVKYHEIEYFTDGLARVKIYDKYGFIDTTGKEIIPCIYSMNPNNTPYFRYGLARVGLNNKWGFINRTGKVVIPLEYDEISLTYLAKGEYSYLFNGFATVQKNKKYSILDTAGKVIVPCTYEYCGQYFHGLAEIKSGYKIGFVNKTGKIKASLKYTKVKRCAIHCSKFCNGFTAVSINNKWGFIDSTGKEVVPPKYDELDRTFEYFRVLFSDGFALVKLNNKYGFIDETGKEVVPLIYDSAAPFQNGIAEVRIGSESGYVNKSGKFSPFCKNEN